ncbi:hypothetical protein FEM33_14835 [Dyadobacter flavalbus]|uniref:Uncharacterized protein n=1 Tax=Dyadobacter flavalbus TaxID=2579942 RepID=A0A5M8QWF0_9BACT|nr:hypothetical protein [Dyadobacter flavalbus]KAA6438976.1 hypothetical protein FEM33_14835 [Dyadobacter flavalbus]
MSIFKASDNIPACYQYIEHHQKMLKKYNAANITSGISDWIENEHTYLLLLRSYPDSALFGGARIQIKNSGLLLPVEKALKDYQENLLSKVAFSFHRVAELCGVWFKFNKNAIGCGFSSMQLIRSAVAIAPQLQIDRLLAFCSPTTFPLCLNTGGQVVSEVGDQGKLLYPNAAIVSTLVVYDDLVNLKHARKQEKEIIFSLRQDSFHPMTFKGILGEGTLHFDLDLITEMDKLEAV